LDQAGIQQRVASGLGRAAQILGVQGVQYRPSGPMSPLSVIHATPMVAFDVDASFGMVKPLGWGVPTEYALTNTNDVQVGDVLSASGSVYFVARVEAMRPALCVPCMRVVSITGVTGSPGQVAEGCPAAIWMKSHGDRDGSIMPGSERPGQFMMFLPLLPSMNILSYMSVFDDLGGSYTIVSVENSAFGVRCLMTTQQV